MSLGTTIAELRKENNLTQKELALFLNLTSGTISNYEKDIHEPSLKTLVKLADRFDVSVDYLLNRTKTEKSLIHFDKNYVKNYNFAKLINQIYKFDRQDRIRLVDYIQLIDTQKKHN